MRLAQATYFHSHLVSWQDRLGKTAAAIVCLAGMHCQACASDLQEVELYKFCYIIAWLAGWTKPAGRIRSFSGGRVRRINESALVRDWIRVKIYHRLRRRRPVSREMIVVYGPPIALRASLQTDRTKDRDNV